MKYKKKYQSKKKLKNQINTKIYYIQLIQIIKLNFMILIFEIKFNIITLYIISQNKKIEKKIFTKKNFHLLKRFFL